MLDSYIKGIWGEVRGALTPPPPPGFASDALMHVHVIQQKYKT